MQLTDLQSQFGQALHDGLHEGLTAWLRDDGTPAGARFDLYRKSHFASLESALSATFPKLARLLGEDPFRQLATAFIRAHPPVEPCLDSYGEALPKFLSELAFPPNLAYVPDLARLEWLVQRARLAPRAPTLSTTQNSESA